MKPDFNKSKDGLLPAIIQDEHTNNVLMLGYMNKEALEITLKTSKVTFYSRSKQRLWTKGEASDNFLRLVDIKLDCDNDTFLIHVVPDGPACHTGSDTCWDNKNISNFSFLTKLEKIIGQRIEFAQNENSYVADLMSKGINKIAQKFGEEAVELIIEAKDNDDDLFLNESADMLFHYLVLLQAKGFKLCDIEGILKNRHKKMAK